MDNCLEHYFYDEDDEEEKETYEKEDYSKYIHRKLKERNLSMRELAERLGVNYETLRKVVNREKETKNRDYIIAIGFALGLDFSEMASSLHRYNYMPGLDDTLKREELLWSLLDERNNKKIYTVNEVNEFLLINGFPTLLYKGSRGERKKVTKEPKYQRVGIYLPNPEEEENPWDSLVDVYHPKVFFYQGGFLLQETKNESIFVELLINEHINRISLEVKRDYQVNYYTQTKKKGETKPVTTKDEEKCRNYNDWSSTGEFKDYFYHLELQMDKKIKGYLDILNDTRNYMVRTSAKFETDAMLYFSETFDFIHPLKPEYYFMEMKNNQYRMSVFKASVFMTKYLSDEAYQNTYGDFEEKPIEVYSSVDEIEAISDIIRSKDLKKAFSELKECVDNQRTRIKDRKDLVRDSTGLFSPEELDAIRFYGLETKYNLEEEQLKVWDERDKKGIHFQKFTFGKNYTGKECVDAASKKRCKELREKRGVPVRVASYGDNYTNTAIFDTQNGDSIEITCFDLLRAFELGIDNIEAICDIKQKYGSIDGII